MQPDGGDWCNRLRKLDPSDIRGPGKATDDPTPVPNGRYEMSWIWLVSRHGNESNDGNEEDDVFDESLRAEWAKMLARRDRWEEEYLLVQEEMRRVIVYLKWKAEWWKEQGSRRVSDDAGLVEGLLAYAERQAGLFKGLAESCAQTWQPALLKEGITPSWPNMFIVVDNTAEREREIENGDREQEVLDDDSDEESNGFDCFELDL